MGSNILAIIGGAVLVGGLLFCAGSALAAGVQSALWLTRKDRVDG